MPNEVADGLLEHNASMLFDLFAQVGIVLSEQERQDFSRGLWAFAKINVNLFNWSLLGDVDFAEMAPRRFIQLWHAFRKSNPEFIVLVNRLKQGLQEASALAETPSAGEA